VAGTAEVKRGVVAALAAVGLAAASGSSAGTHAVDRTSIAYGAGGEIRLVAAAGTGAHSIAKGDAPSWSPDGRVLVFDSARTGPDLDLWIMNADGSSQRHLATHPAEGEPADAADDFDPAWSPNDDTIAFISNRSGNDDIWLTNSIGHMTTNLTRTASNERSPAWSPDGASLAFVSDRAGTDDVYTIGRDGFGVERVTNSPAAEESPAWSPDGREIAFQSLRDGNWEIYAVTVEGSATRRLTTDAAADTHPSWSPDGSRIVFTSDRGPSHTPALYVMPATGGAARALTSNEAADNADWQPAVDVALGVRAPATVRLGKVARVRLEVTSGTPLPALRTAMTIRVTGAARVVRVSSSRGSCARSRTISCALGTILASSRASVELALRPTRCRTFTVQASATGQRVDLDPTNNSRRQTIRVSCR